MRRELQTASRSLGWVLLTLLTAVVLFAQSGHWTLVAHAYCVTHGELTHATHEDGAHAEETSTDHSALFDADAHDHDEHCSATISPAELPTTCAVAEPGVVLARLMGGLRSTRVDLRSRLYLLAPKTSPPPHPAPLS